MDYKTIKAWTDLARSVRPFVNMLGKALFSSSSKVSSTPALAPSIQKDQRYSEALQLYRQQLAQSERIQSQQLQAQLKFNEQLIELLSEVQIRNNKAKQDELQLLWDKDNWFSRLNRQETEQILGQKNHRLLILVAPPNISSDCPESFQNNLSREVDNNTRLFLNHHYSQNQLCPVEFYGDYFEEAISTADVRRLQIVLGAVPTAVIYTDITDYQVYFHIGFWGLQGTITQFDMQPWNWERAVEKLKSEGLDDQKAYRRIRQTIVEFHQLLAAFITDWYYLNLNLSYEPQLLQSEISFNSLPEELIEQYVAVLREIQQQRQEALEQEEAYREAEKEQKESTDQSVASGQRNKDDGNLQGSNGTNYEKLRDLLAARKWRGADEETCSLMRQLANCQYGRLDEATIHRLPMPDLQKIDELWLKYSEGHFGFSVQLRILQNSRSCGEFLGKINCFESRKYSDRYFSLSASKGSLPYKVLGELPYVALLRKFHGIRTITS